MQDKSRVLVLGGGPAGSFFAALLIGRAKQARLDIEVVIVDPKLVEQPGNPADELKGCNFCAGIISPRLDKAMEKAGISVPREIICEEFTHIWLHGLWKNFPLKLPPGHRMYSVFRGMQPFHEGGTEKGFDNFLLSHARKLGATAISGEATDITIGSSGKPKVTIEGASGENIAFEPDFVAIATGINFPRDVALEKKPIFSSFRKINPGFTPPKVRRALIFELIPGRDYLMRYMNKEIYFIVSGSKELHLDHISLVPKKDCLTVALVGESIDRASFPEDTSAIIESFFSLSPIRTILPGLTAVNTPIACNCSPFMVAYPSKSVICDRISVVGDALGSRLYRDGLFSAFVTAEALAKTVIQEGVDRESLSRGYDQASNWLEKDNRYAGLVMACVQATLKSPITSRILYQAFATEMKARDQDKRPLGKALLKLGSGVADYVEVFRDLARPAVLFSIARGAVKTARNILVEKLFGLSWEKCGRYPTVILKEKRDYFKKAITAPLKITLDASPEMERMYAVKIRAPSKVIFEELGKFGEANAKFLNLRFMEVKRVAGGPNEVGSVVRYRLRRTPVSMDIRLEKCVEERTLLYKPEELFSRNGYLIFDIARTADGNNRLVIYTGFDFKKGKKLFGRLFWNVFRTVFPDYAHDVVWNHAICRIKREAEDRAVSIDQE